MSQKRSSYLSHRSELLYSDRIGVNLMLPENTRHSRISLWPLLLIASLITFWINQFGNHITTFGAEKNSNKVNAMEDVKVWLDEPRITDRSCREPLTIFTQDNPGSLDVVQSETASSKKI